MCFGLAIARAEREGRERVLSRSPAQRVDAVLAHFPLWKLRHAEVSIMKSARRVGSGSYEISVMLKYRTYFDWEFYETLYDEENAFEDTRANVALEYAKRRLARINDRS